MEPHTVAKWRRRFLEQRPDGLVDEPRPGRPATVTAQEVEDVVVATLEWTRKNATTCPGRGWPNGPGFRRAWVKTWNEHPTPFTWTKTAEQILESLGRLLNRISGAGH
ncbi:helix-turn-helix domain-containing protein [Arthrobacter sp. OV608]|uniref:helix-turn-helix domain-containing protein n=1 Tax=Arthrobacter sp. OV608 TaxID=1882768 RepID=UPI001B8C8C82|nr:helix-turn-helix domain-containing protein [Arthrobacter sp. OV608]